MRKFSLGVVVGILLGAGSMVGAWWYLRLTAKPPTMPTISVAERQFQQTLAKAELVGFTAPLNGGEPSADHYSIGAVDKLGGETWKVVAKIVGPIGIPLELDVKWAGDTPVITLSDVAIPGFGTYSARVLFFQDHYSGVWSGGGEGGYVYGKIEHPAAASQPTTRGR